MASPWRPSILLGPNVAQVRPMVHTRPVVTTAVGQTVRPPTLNMSLLGSNQTSTTSFIQQTSLPLDKAPKPSPMNTKTVMVPPGRYKYSWATCNGKQGVYLTPISDPTSPNTTPAKGVFVPFNADGTNPVKMVPSSPGQQNDSKSASTKLASLAGEINRSTDKSLMNIPTIAPTASQPKIIFNILQPSAPVTGVLPASSCAPVLTTSPVTNLHKTMKAKSNTPIGVPAPSAPTPSYKPAPTWSYKPLFLSYPAKNVNPTKTASKPPSAGALYGNLCVNTKPVATGLGYSNKLGSIPTVPTKPTTSNSYIWNQTGSLSFKPQSGIQGQSQSHISVKTEGPQANVPIITCPPLTASPANEEIDSSGTESAISGELDTSTESEDLPFKIDSVFSLCEDTEPSRSESPAADQKKLDGCQFPEAWFVALQLLDLKGHRSIDVRKFRKFTGRQSCSKTCRQSSLIKLCRKQKLIVFENTTVKTEEDTELSDMLGTNYGMGEPQIVVKRENLEEESMMQSLDTTSTKYKPGPKSKKLLRIKLSQKKKKSKNKAFGKSDEGRGTGDPVDLDPKGTNLINYPGRLIQDVKPIPDSIIAPPVTIKSNFLPGNSNDSPPIDTNSAAFKQAISALGCKKFYLMRIEGKNILLPVEQNTLQPRAYILGGDKFQSAAKTDSPKVVDSPKVTTSRVKTEPKDTGYDKQALSSQENTGPIRIKEERTDRGYSDEGPSQKKRSAASTSLSSPESMPPLLDSLADCTGEVPEKMPRLEPEAPREATSDERIQQLKEMLRKQQEALEKVRMMRKDQSVLSESEDKT